MSTRRHSVSDLAAELNKILPAYTQGERAAMAVIGSVFGNVTIRTEKHYVEVRDGRFYSAYKRPKSQQRTLHRIREMPVH